MEIVDGIHLVDDVNAHVYVVVDGKQLTLIDTGMPGNSRKILDYVGGMSRQASDVSWIVLTHFHVDHTGSASKLKEATGAKVAVHEEDADFVAGKKPAPKPKSILFRALSSIIKVEPVEPDIRLKEGDTVGRLTVVHASGHTPGSICLHDAERKALFVGDALRCTGRSLQEPRQRFTTDVSAAKRSIQRLSALDFDLMLCGHGGPLMPGAAARLREFSESLR